MNNCWLLIGEIDGKIDYGVDDNFFLLGIYQYENNARTSMKCLSESEDPFIVDDDNIFRDPYDGYILFGKTFDQYYDVRPEPIKWKELTYKVIPFTGSAVFIG